MKYLAQAVILSSLLFTNSNASAATRVSLLHMRPEGYLFKEGNPYFEGDTQSYFSLECSDTCRLRKTQITSAYADVPNSEAGGGGTTPGVILKGDEGKPLMLIRGIPALTEGEVTTWYVSPTPVELLELVTYWEKNVDVPVGDRTLRIAKKRVAKVQPGTDGDDDIEKTAEQWTFSYDGVTRTLAYIWDNWLFGPEGRIGAREFVVWVGDIDKDERPDVLVRPQERPDEIGLALFLSSQLKTGKPWTPAAKFYFWEPTNPGC